MAFLSSKKNWILLKSRLGFPCAGSLNGCFLHNCLRFCPGDSGLYISPGLIFEIPSCANGGFWMRILLILQFPGMFYWMSVGAIDWVKLSCCVACQSNHLFGLSKGELCTFWIRKKIGKELLL